MVLSGITQERIDECRGAKEKEMLADAQALIDSGGDRNSRDEHGATLVCAAAFWKPTYGEAWLLLAINVFFFFLRLKMF